MRRFHQVLLIGSTFLVSWLGMQMVHELGHVLGAVFTDGQVKKVVLSPLTISRTDLGRNPQPLVVTWAGPVFGSIAPLLVWGVFALFRFVGAFVMRFFAGFCLIANGAYIGVGSFLRIGDCGELLNHGAELWQLWLFGVLAIPVGFTLWNGQGIHFGLNSSQGEVSRGVTYATFAASVLLLMIGFWVGGD